MSKSILGLLLFLLTAGITRAEQPIFNISTTEGNPGETVEIDFYVDNYTNIISAQFSVNWDPTVIDFVSIKNLNSAVTGLSPANFNVEDFIDEGKFAFTWFEASLNPISLPDGSLYFTVEFMIVGDPCDRSNVAITNDPTEIEVSEPGEIQVGLQSNIGRVEVPGTGCSEDIQLVGNSVVGSCGSTTCIQFTVENFTDVGAIEFSLAYNPAVLQFDRIQNFASLLAFGTGNTNLQAPGNIRIVWFNGNAQNESLPDGTVLFEVCFDVIGTGGQSSTITFGTSPNPMFSDIDGNPYATSIVPASITAQCALEGFAFIADTVCTNPGGLACIPIKVNDFDDIIAFGFSMNWDSTVFEFDHLEGFNLAGLGTDLFGTPANQDIDEGMLTVVWIDLSLEGVTVPDFTSIFTVCLRAVGPAGSATPFNFTSNPLDIEVQNAADSIIVPALLQGRGEIKVNCDACSISYTLNATSPDCPREENGSLDLSVDSGNCPGSPSYLWSYQGRTTQDLINVPAGTYT
ncbi:MAG: cohesin domain-containing protein, partial [Bacteroidota bacterium]|nr:cohesin domain-containing protein [Bacteroidota bacterium]